MFWFKFENVHISFIVMGEWLLIAVLHPYLVGSQRMYILDLSVTFQCFGICVPLAYMG